MLDLKDKLVLVTGAARGIGRAVAFEYAKHGAHLIILDILGDKLDATAADMRKEGYVVHAFVCDLASDTGIASLGAQIIKDIGVPDILHNNAFWAPQGSVEDIDIDIIRRALDISVLGYLRIIKAFVNDMMARKSGWIVNTSSPNGITPKAEWAAMGLPYNLCKAADISMSQALAAGLKKYGIGVTVVYPGSTLTEAI
ncbi:NAD(P)-binding protein, partial [Lepidopterella palustris CBS 459.81]